MTDSYPWFSRLVRHPARKRIGSILTTPEPARGSYARCITRYTSDRRQEKASLNASAIIMAHFVHVSTLKLLGYSIGVRIYDTTEL